MVDETNKKFDKDEKVIPQMEDDTLEADDDSAYDDDISDDDYEGDDDIDDTEAEEDDDYDVSDDEITTPLVKKLYATAKSEDDDDDDDDWWKDGGDYSSKQREELEHLYSGTLRQFNENEIVSGTVVSIGDKEVVLNIGFKSEGVVPISEFRSRNQELKVGDKVEVFIESVEDQDGQLILSRKRAKNLRSWEMINDSMDNDTIIMGHVMRRTKGGFVVDVNGIEAFLPGSQIDVKPVRDFDVYVGRNMEFKVVKINHAYENVVVSHKILIEAKLEEQRKEILEKLEKGQVLEGTVKNMTNFGVFIDLGGVDGLLHITDISWGRINHPEEVLELDQKVNVVVLEFDDAKKRISLGMKQLTPHPWESLPENLVEGTKVKGKIVTVAEYGVFLEILPGVEGLIHTSEMSWSQHSKNPTEMFRSGDELEAVVLSIDRDDRKMSLGLKQLLNDPWSDIETRYPVGSSHTGLVRNMTNYGLFVELQEGVDGLVHISDLSWTKKFSHPSEYVKVDDKLEVVVLDIDKENRRLSLGHKQLTEDVWDTFAAIFTVGSVHKGTIKKIQTKGATVELDYGVEGIVPPKHLSVEDGKELLKVDDAAEFVVIEFHKDAKRLVLSHTRAWKEEEAPAEQPKSKDNSSSKGQNQNQNQGQNQNQNQNQNRTKGNNNPAPTAKAGTTTLGELDVLAKLKEQMEAEEQKGGKKKSSKKKEDVPADNEEVSIVNEPEMDDAGSDDESDE
ncbi:MAG: 30S ribosomal protein S1 [Bacteroidia bacterium]|nr:30S ribosomal protein S1 [Bacteroidia bacterium]